VYVSSGAGPEGMRWKKGDLGLEMVRKDRPVLTSKRKREEAYKSNGLSAKS